MIEVNTYQAAGLGYVVAGAAKRLNSWRYPADEPPTNHQRTTNELRRIDTVRTQVRRSPISQVH
ncbi:hypothetical protein [Alicyclobacillus sp. ALC3]|uniref:hypothetical protein n=1 Tax=Alicyclobacillus sp. ALC3 TaxID=2796143 RepID=UPI002377EFD0|nr:hypothetical protein [Alicyclobacillus sp. ALC3]WDL95198.1 hypothetical protein JC200_12270 [Alicyclobacillus sp. ALC3]